MIFEKWGLYGNAERRTQAWREQVPPPGDARNPFGPETPVQYLRGVGHKLKPVIMVGDAGLSPSLLEEFEEKLLAYGYADLHASKYASTGYSLSTSVPSTRPELPSQCLLSTEHPWGTPCDPRGQSWPIDQAVS